MKILIINLARATQRRAFMRRQLDGLGLDYAFVASTDYREMREEDFRAKCDPRALTGDNYLKGVFAASLSHLSACQQIIDDGLDVALICEDDAVFPPNIRAILESITATIRPDEIVLLSYYSHLHKPLALSTRHATSIEGGLQLLAPVAVDEVASAMAYVVPRQTAARMLEVLRPVNHVPDHWGQFYQKGAFAQLRCLHPHVMADAPFPSIVEYRGTKTMAFKVKSMLRKTPLVQFFIRRAMQRQAMAKYQFQLVDAKPFWE